MRRILTLAAAWLVAAGVAVAFAWQGVGIVTDQVTDRRPAPLAAGEIRALAEGDGGPEGTTTTTATDPGPGSTTPTSGPPTSAPRGTAGPATPPTTAAPSEPGSSPTTTAPPPEEAPSETTRTYSLVGGTASLRFSPTGVTVLWANPNPGFETEVEPEHGNGVKVEFESESHRSRVDGWWDGGPQDRVREDAR